MLEDVWMSAAHEQMRKEYLAKFKEMGMTLEQAENQLNFWAYIVQILKEESELDHA